MTAEPDRIVDFHSHIAATMCFPESFRNGVVDNMSVAFEARGLSVPRAHVATMLEATMQDPLCDQLIADMDAAGIHEAVLLLPDFTYALRDSTHTIAELIEHHRVVLKRHPGRFRAFAGVDPRWGSDGLALFEKAVVDYGFDGMKIYPPCGYRIDDRMLFPFYEICAQHGLPVLTHIGATSPVLDSEIARPIFVEAAARSFPDIDFVLAHGSVHYADECIMLCRNRPNIYIDISGYETASMSDLNHLFQRGVNHKVVFGTDWPVFRMQGRQTDFLARFDDESAFPDAMTERERRLFFHGNADRLLSKARTPAERCQQVIQRLDEKPRGSTAFCDARHDPDTNTTAKGRLPQHDR